MIAAPFSLEIAKIGRKIWSNSCRRSSEDLLVQINVIFPRVHVARNVRGVNRHAAHLFSMRIEQRAETSLRIERQQFITVNEID